MKSWTNTVQHTVAVCLFAATCGCVAPRPPAAADASSGGELNSDLSAERKALAEGLAHYGVAVGQDWNQQSDAARSNFLRAAELDPYNQKLQLRVAFDLLRDQRPDEAYDLMANTAERFPKSEQAQLWAAYFARTAKRPATALEYYDRAIKIAPESPKAYIEKTATLTGLDRVEEAIGVLRTALARGVEHEDIPPLLGQIYIQQTIALRDPARMAKNAASALDVLVPLFKTTPRDATLMVEIAVLQKLAGDNEAALKTFADNADILPSDARWRQRQIGALFRGEPEAALRAARQLVEKNPTNENYLLALGHLEEQARNTEAAENAFRKATELAPDDIAPVLRLGLLLNAEKRTDDAAILFTSALKKNPDSAPLLELMAYLEVTRDRPKEALDYFKRAAARLAAPYEKALTPYFEVSYILTCLQAGETEQAAQLIHTHIGGSDDIVEVLFSLLVVEKNKDRVKQGILALQRVSELEPDAAFLYTYLGLLHGHIKQYTEAVESFARAEQLAHEQEIEEDVLTPAFYFWYGATCEQAGLYDKALEQFEKCIAAKPPQEDLKAYSAYVDALNYIAYMNAERGQNLERGLTLINEALEVRPDNAAYIDTRGWIYFMQGKYAEARDDIERANALMPDDPTITDHLGDVYAKLGVIEEATDWWKRSFLLDPSNEQVAEKLTAQNVDLEPLKKEAEARETATDDDSLDTLSHLAAPATLLKGDDDSEDTNEVVAPIEGESP